MKRVTRFPLVMIIMLPLLLMSCSEQKPIDIYLIGDSITATKPADEYPRTGWGQVLPEYFNENATIHNHARNGRSTKSFLDEGRWKTVYDSLQAGDWVIIQFGHNDEKAYDTTRYADPDSAFPQNLTRFINETKEKNAHALLMTPVVRRKFNEQGELVPTHGKYPDAVREVAEKTGVNFIDITKRSRHLVDSLGVEDSKQLYLLLEPGDFETWPDGLEDNSHLSEYGANKICGMITDGIREKGMPLKEYLAE